MHEAPVSGGQYFSQWPGKEGHAGSTASRDYSIAGKSADAVAEEYRDVGLHWIPGHGFI